MAEFHFELTGDGMQIKEIRGEITLPHDMLVSMVLFYKTYHFHQEYAWGYNHHLKTGDMRKANKEAIRRARSLDE